MRAIGRRAIDRRDRRPLGFARLGVAPRLTVVAARWPVVPRAVVAARWPVVPRAVVARRGGQRGGLGGLPLGCRAAECAARRGDNPGGLGAHPEDAPAARGEDLEVEVVEADRERLPGVAQGFLDGLSGEFLVGTHVSVVSLGGPCGRCVRGVGRSSQLGRPARRYS